MAGKQIKAGERARIRGGSNGGKRNSIGRGRKIVPKFSEIGTDLSGISADACDLWKVVPRRHSSIGERRHGASALTLNRKPI